VSFKANYGGQIKLSTTYPAYAFNSNNLLVTKH
jgi:hypothetical protein